LFPQFEAVADTPPYVLCTLHTVEDRLTLPLLLVECRLHVTRALLLFDHLFSPSLGGCTLLKLSSESFGSAEISQVSSRTCFCRMTGSALSDRIVHEQVCAPSFHSPAPVSSGGVASSPLLPRGAAPPVHTSGSLVTGFSTFLPRLLRVRIRYPPTAHLDYPLPSSPQLSANSDFFQNLSFVLRLTSFLLSAGPLPPTSANVAVTRERVESRFHLPSMG